MAGAIADCRMEIYENRWRLIKFDKILARLLVLLLFCCIFVVF